MTSFPVIVPKPLLILVAVALVIMTAIFWGSDQALTPLYYATMCLLGGFALQGHRGQRVEAWLQGIAVPVVPRALLLGYAAVIFEEVLVGTFYTLNEGWTLLGWLQRVQQFVSFNLLAFTGAIVGLTLAVLLLPGLSRWHLLIAGGWGLFAEGSYLLIATNPLAAALIAGPNIAVYAIILAPMVLSMPQHNDPVGKGRKPWAPLVAWGLMLAFSLPAVWALSTLRGAYPEAFPPCAYIACDR